MKNGIVLDLQKLTAECCRDSLRWRKRMGMTMMRVSARTAKTVKCSGFPLRFIASLSGSPVITVILLLSGYKFYSKLEESLTSVESLVQTVSPSSQAALLKKARIDVLIEKVVPNKQKVFYVPNGYIASNG